MTPAEIQEWGSLASGWVIAVGVLFNIVATIRSGRETKKAARQAREAAQAAAFHVRGVAANIEKIEIATNSMMAAREAAATIIGHAAGIAEEKARGSK